MPIYSYVLKFIACNIVLLQEINREILQLLLNRPRVQFHWMFQQVKLSNLMLLYQICLEVK